MPAVKCYDLYVRWLGRPLHEKETEPEMSNLPGLKFNSSTTIEIIFMLTMSVLTLIIQAAACKRLELTKYWHQVRATKLIWSSEWKRCRLQWKLAKICQKKQLLKQNTPITVLIIALPKFFVYFNILFHYTPERLNHTYWISCDKDHSGNILLRNMK